MRILATIKNAFWGITYQLMITLLGFITRKIMVLTIGLAGISLNGLFSNVLSILSLAEMGVGTAIVYHLYIAIVQKDDLEICRLMNFYKFMYRFIAGIIFVIGILLIPFLKYIINDVDYSWQYIIFIYVLFLIQTSTTYLFSYKRSILLADQKQYVCTTIDIIFKVLIMVVSCIVLFFTKSFELYLIVLIVLGLFNNYTISKKVDRLYPIVLQSEKLPKNKRNTIFRNVKDIFIGQVSYRITESTSNILISALVGTLQIGLYSNYTLITGALRGFVSKITAAMQGSIGNLVHSETNEYIEERLRHMTFFMYMIGSFICVSTYCMINPFIKLWLGEEYLLPTSVVLVIIINLFLMIIRDPLWFTLGATGLFRWDKYIALTGSIANLGLAFGLGRIIGINGILLGTTITVVVQYILKTIVLYKKYLNMNGTYYIAISVGYFILMLFEAIVTVIICQCFIFENDILRILAYLTLCCIVPNLINILIFYKTKSFVYLKNVFLYDLKNKGKK